MICLSYKGQISPLNHCNLLVFSVCNILKYLLGGTIENTLPSRDYNLFLNLIQNNNGSNKEEYGSCSLTVSSLLRDLAESRCVVASEVKLEIFG